MKTDNELIAEFMGLIQHPHDKTMFTEEQFYLFEDGQHYGLWKRSAFSTSWDWLMPVIEKIHNEYIARITIDVLCTIVNHRMEYELEDKRFYQNEYGGKIEATFEAVLHIIHLHNTSVTSHS